MSLRDALLPEFDLEMSNTRKTLDRVPEDKLSWTPHEKSGTMGWLATHVAEIPHWAMVTIGQDSIDLAPPGAERPVPKLAGSRSELLETFDRNVAAARAAIETAEDACLLRPWTLLSGGKVLFTMPRIGVLRSFVMNHLVHHRAQLGLYLRLQDVPVPAIYGPSADEGAM